MPILYKSLTALLAFTGCISLFFSGQMNLMMSISGIALLPGYYRFLKGEQHAPKWAVGLLSTATLLVFVFDAVIVSGDVVLAVAHLTVTFQALKSFDLKEPWDHLQVYFMSLLQLIIASELTRALTFGVIFVMFIILLATAMVLSHFLKEGSLGSIKVRRPVSAIVLMTLLSTAILFVALPRTSHRVFGKSHDRGMKTVGFSERVAFGSFGDVKLNPAIVMRIETDRKINPPYYWRGTTMDYFDGQSWRNTTKGAGYRLYRSGNEFQLYPYDMNTAIEQRIYFEPIDSDIVFGLARILAVRADTPYITVDDAAEISMPGKLSRRVTYSVLSDINARDTGEKEYRYLLIPEGMQRIADLASEIAGNAVSEKQKAEAIEEHLLKNYTYSLSTSPPAKGMNPIEDFIFNSKRGYCEHYATSMVIMLRGIGIPARIVNGFSGGEINEFGNYIIVRQQNAHSWVEALISGVWQRYDPTPSSAVGQQSTISFFIDALRMKWTRYVVEFSSYDQRKIFRKFTMPFRFQYLSDLKLKSIANLLVVVCTSALIIVAAYLSYKKFSFRKYGFATGVYLKFRQLLIKKGIKLTPSMTSSDIRKNVTGLKIEKDTDEFLKLYEEDRFGKRQMSGDQRLRYLELYSKFKQHKNDT